MSIKWDETILAVSREELFNNEQDVFQGVLTDSEKVDKIADRLTSFVTMRKGHRDDPTPKENNAEINFEYKQPITYIVIRKGDQVFLYKRLAGGGEVRLFNKLSIGVGGHMNKQEGTEDFGTLILENLFRELDEELEMETGEIQLSTIGFINDDSDDVGKVHIGILIVADIDEDSNVEVKEKDKLQGEWVTISSLLQEDVFSKLENWSQITVKALE